MTIADGRRAALRDVAAVMLKLGTIAFGGPAVHVAMLREEVVKRRRWIDDASFLDLFGAVSVLPGPSSTQLAIVLSKRRAGWLGLIVGGVCFIAPAMLIVLGLAYAYVHFGATPTAKNILYGVEPIVVAIVAVALYELSKSALKKPWFVVLGLGTVVMYLLRANILVPLLLAGVIVAIVENRHHAPPPPMLIALPIAATTVHAKPTVFAILKEFAKLGVIVFGSGYVLLAFLRADVVGSLHWLTERQVLDAVAAGQVTPGPVFTTATFVGYLLGGLPGAVAATAGIFVPSFFMVAGVDRVITTIRRSRWLAPALDGITVAALGLMAGVTFDLARDAVHDVQSAIVAIAALALTLWKRPNALLLIAAGALIGVLTALV